jgi:asparagine synthase (glutamine-hydrolysing)
MCGIAGIIGEIAPNFESAVHAMTDAQAHRGPDDAGFFRSADDPGVLLGFRRLAIIDLSPDGHQPMRDPLRGNVIVFNGEIYNHHELRAELESLGEVFQSRSDTEVLLRAYGRWGSEMLGRLRGMFAFALYDPSARSVLLARDRLGIKPLYYAELGKKLVFASELRAILASGLLEKRLNPRALSSYAWNGFVVGPETIASGVKLLPAGTKLEVSVGAPRARVERYWSLRAEPTRTNDALADLHDELSTAARQHLLSDVPLGVFLSGGVDSTAVAAMAVRAATSPVRTFHVGFDEAGFDESSYARAVATSLGTEHVEFRLTQARFSEWLDAAMAGLDQPSFDAINTYFVSRVVREAGFTVALAGTGGDELFGGYRSFRDLPRARLASAVAGIVPNAMQSQLLGLLRTVRGRSADVPPQTRWAKLGDMLATGGAPLAAYQVAYGLFTREFLAKLVPKETLALAPYGLPPERAEELEAMTAGTTALSGVSLLELALFLGERLLRDSDAASMAVSLELRVPLLDHRVVEAVQAVPDRVRYEPLGRKQILRSVATPKVDPSVFDRPKAGFVLPIEVWAKDRLAPEIEAMFSDRNLVERIGFDGATLVRLFRAFRAGAPGIYWSRIWAPYALLRWCKAHGLELS